MRKVRLIDDNWSQTASWFQNVLAVGDPIPVLDEIYTVASVYLDKDGKEKGIQLQEFDYSAYGVIGMFAAIRFETVEWIHAPNMVEPLTGSLAETYSLYIDFPISDEEAAKIYQAGS